MGWLAIGLLFIALAISDVAASIERVELAKIEASKKCECPETNPPS